MKTYLTKYLEWYFNSTHTYFIKIHIMLLNYLQKINNNGLNLRNIN